MGRSFLRGFLTFEASVVFCASVIAQPPAAKVPLFPPIAPNQARLTQIMGGLDGPGLALAYCEETGILVAACEGGTIRYWDKAVTLGIRSGDNTANVLELHKGPLTALASTSGSVFASVGVDQKMLTWTLPDHDILQAIPTPGVVRALCFAPDGKLLAAAGDNPEIRLLDLVTRKIRTSLRGHTDAVLCLAISPDGKLLASGGYDTSVRLWELNSGKKLLDLPVQPPPAPNTQPGPTNTAQALAFSPDGKQLAVGGSDAQIHLLNVADGKILRSLPGHDSSITSLVFHPSGTLLVSGSKDRTVRLWNPANGQPIKTLEGHSSWVQGVTFIAGGTRLASVSADQTIRLWDLR